jgi:outer membrane murein-binding lipoprotein Lpp
VTRAFALAVAALLAVLALAPVASASTPRERQLARQVKTLKASNARLTRERNAARAALGVCQAGVPQAIGTMTPEQLSANVLPVAKAVFDAQPGSIELGWSTFTSSSHTESPGSYESWYVSFDFTRWTP